MKGNNSLLQPLCYVLASVVAVLGYMHYENIMALMIPIIIAIVACMIIRKLR